MKKTERNCTVSPVKPSQRKRAAKALGIRILRMRSSSSPLMRLLSMLLLSILPLFSVAQSDFTASHDMIEYSADESPDLTPDQLLPEAVEGEASLTDIIPREESAAGNYSHPDCWLKNNSGYSVSLTGSNPSAMEIFTAMRSLSVKYDVPLEIIGAVCYKESGLFHYGADGFVVHNLAECKSLYHGKAGGPPGLGLMQLTGVTAKEYDPNCLIADWNYNLEAGVKVLRQKYCRALSISSSSPQAMETGNWNALDNWRYALAFYNGYKTLENPYVSNVCNIIASPPSGLSRLFAGLAMIRPQDEIE